MIMLRYSSFQTLVEMASWVGGKNVEAHRCVASFPQRVGSGVHQVFGNALATMLR